MKKLLFVWLFFSCPVLALVAPRMYVVDSSCPKNAPFREGQWHSHKDKEGGYYTPSFGNCISCDTTKAFMLVDAKDCGLCPNRTVEGVDTIPGFIFSNYCRLKTCPPEKPFYDENWNWSGCKSCQDEPKHIKKEECEQCSNMRWIEGAGCAPDKSDRMYYNGKVLFPDGTASFLDGGSPPFVITCDSEKWQHCEAIKTSEEECKKCPFTYMKNGFCHVDGWKKIKACPEGHVRNICGFCIACDVINGDKFFSEEECEKCPYHIFNNGHCNRNGSPDLTQPLIEHRDLGGGWVIENYYTCDEERGISTTKENCDVCPNRIYIEGLCALKECPYGKLMGQYHECIDCEDILYNQPDITQEECLKCPNLIYKKGQCLFKVSQIPDGRFIFKDNLMWTWDHCNYLANVETEKEYCDLCANREYIDGKCVLKNRNK